MNNPLKKRFRYTYFNATFYIIAINIIFFLATFALPKLKLYLSLNPLLVVNHKMYWQILTSMFMHNDLSHILLNMLGLLFFGLHVEKSMGSKEFILYYLLCGLLANVFSLFFYIFTNQPYVFLLGASGALFSVLFAFSVIFPTVKVFIFGIVPVPGPILILIYTIIEIGSLLFSVNSNVGHMTHLSGFAIAWLYFIIRLGIDPIKAWKNTFR